MSEQISDSVLRKMLAPKGPAASTTPLTVTRALRVSAARAAEKTIGLDLSVRSVSEESLDLDALMARVGNDLLLLQLHQDEAVGLAAVDAGLLAAVVEAQTMGKLSTAQPTEREMTAVDASLAEPFVVGLLDEMVETVCGTDLEGWIDDVVLNGRFMDLRQIGLTLKNTTYRLLQMSIDLVGTERSGHFFLALPMPHPPAKKQPKDSVMPDWGTSFSETVGLAQASLPVILHRFEISLSTLDHLKIGQTLPLSRSRVDTARLEMPDGALVAKGRLGQMAGHFAIRLEDPAPDILQDLASNCVEPQNVSPQSEELTLQREAVPLGAQDATNDGEHRQERGEIGSKGPAEA